MTKRLDWPAMMRAGLLGLRLEPSVFWSLTPAELRVMLGTEATRAPMRRAGLDALMAAYPDHRRDGNEEDET